MALKFSATQLNSMFIQTRGPNSIQLFYSIFGTGPKKVLLIMGFGADSTLWDMQLNSFGSEFSICTFDNRGIGYSDAPDGRYTTTMMANDAEDLLIHLNWTLVNVVGYSMGGMIAQELCLSAPHLISSLVLVATTTGRSIPPISSMRHFAKQNIDSSIQDQFSWAVDIVHPQDWLDSPNKENPSKKNREILWEVF